MAVEKVRSELLAAGLNEESTNRMIEHYQDMRTYLSRNEFVEAGTHVGNFCENVANILLVEMGEPARPHISVGSFVNECINGQIGTDLPDEARLTIPRMMRAAYDIRNSRDSVHVNLEVSVNRADTQTAIRICSWILSELLRLYGNESEMDEIADLIDELSQPMTPYIDEYRGNRMIQHTGLEVREEILLHLLNEPSEVDADDLVEWIPGASSRQIKGTLSRLKQERKARYDSDRGMARITPRGAELARDLESEYFEVSESTNLTKS